MDAGDVKGEQGFVKCIVCGQSFIPSDAIRFRGAITCRSCAMKAMAFETQGKMSWPFWLAVFGGLLGGAVCLLVQIAFFSRQEILQVELYYAFVGVSVGLLSLGFAGLSKNFEAHYSIIPAFLGLVASPLSIILTLQGISEVLESYPPFTPPLGISVGLSADVLVSIFMLFAAIVILLTRDRFKSENLSIIAASVLLVAGSARYLVPFAVPLAYVLTGLLFSTTVNPVELGLQAELDYS